MVGNCGRDKRAKPDPNFVHAGAATPTGAKLLWFEVRNVWSVPRTLLDEKVERGLRMNMSCLALRYIAQTCERVDQPIAYKVYLFLPPLLSLFLMARPHSAFGWSLRRLGCPLSSINPPIR